MLLTLALESTDEGDRNDLQAERKKHKLLKAKLMTVLVRPRGFFCRSPWVAEWFVLSPEYLGSKDRETSKGDAKN